jgi:hypothetical protein
MAELESMNTMLQNSFVEVADGSYAQQVTSIAPGTTPDGGSSGSSGPNAESGFGIGSVVAPAADTVIATHTPPAANAGKLHKIVATVWFSATAPTGVDNANMAFKFGGTVISAIPAVPDLHIPVTVEFYFKAAAGTPFAIVSVGAGTAGVQYNAFITATRIV